MEDRKKFLDSDFKYISKFYNKKRKKEKKVKIKRIKFNISNDKLLYAIITILILIIIFLLGIIAFKKRNIKIYPEPKDFLYINTSEINEPKSLFIYKEDHTEIKDKNILRICYCIDNNLIYPTLVSMTSALENNNREKNIIIFYLLIPGNFKMKNVEIFDSLKKKYLVKIHYYKIPFRFHHLRGWMGGTATIYYKLYIPLIFPHLKRILYLDGDTLVHKDLSELFNLDFKDNYVLGYPFHSVSMMDKWGIKLVNYINGGVILFNLEKIIKDNKDGELFEFTLKNNKKLYFLEQDSLNLVFYNKVGLLPLKYGIYLFGNITTYRKSVKKQLRVELNETELIEALNDPALVHFAGCNPKIWGRPHKNAFGDLSVCYKAHDDFYIYANKTEYAEIIYKTYMK